MNRTELIIGMAIILFVAFALGWFAYWLTHRFTRVAGAQSADLERLAQELHEAEETREEAIAWLQERETDLTQRLQEAEARLEASEHALTKARMELMTKGRTAH